MEIRPALQRVTQVMPDEAQPAEPVQTPNTTGTGQGEYAQACVCVSIAAYLLAACVMFLTLHILLLPITCNVVALVQNILLYSVLNFQACISCWFDGYFLFDLQYCTLPADTSCFGQQLQLCYWSLFYLQPFWMRPGTFLSSKMA